MRQVINESKQLNEHIRASEEYRTYLRTKQALLENEELSRHLQEFRAKNYELQNRQGVNPYDEMIELTREYDELLRLADRIVVISEGRLVHECDAADADRHVLGACMGGHDHAPLEARERVALALAAGRTVAYCSDAGMPGVNDPVQNDGRE